MWLAGRTPFSDWVAQRLGNPQPQATPPTGFKALEDRLDQLQAENAALKAKLAAALSPAAQAPLTQPPAAVVAPPPIAVVPPAPLPEPEPRNFGEAVVADALSRQSQRPPAGSAIADLGQQFGLRRAR
jgi:hypothetical protein